MSDTKKILSKADLHVHTKCSDGRCTPADIVEYAEKHTHIDIIAITDHDTIKGAFEAQKIVKKNNYKLEVIVGEEISTTEGHVIGLFLTKVIKPGLSVHETLMQIKSQGGLAIMAHPLHQSRMQSHKKHTFDGVGFINLIKERDNYVAIETMNSSMFLNQSNARTQFLNQTVLFKPEVGGSDAHILKVVGKGYTIFPGNTSEDLKKALITGKTEAYKNKWGFRNKIKYGIPYLPSGIRSLILTLIYGPSPKKPQIKHCKI